MKIWLATVGEPLPSDGENVRLLRTAQFARWLADKGDDVVFWTGTMDHANRRLRHQATTVDTVAPNYRIVQLAGRLYSRSISIRRFLNHSDVAKEFSRVVGRFDCPDVVLSSYPTEELSRAILNYTERRNIPVVLDIRDLWPDIFEDALPSVLRPLASVLFFPLELSARNTFRRADGFTGPAKSTVGWALNKAGREWGDNDFWFPFTYPAPSGEPYEEALPEFLKAPGADERLWFCFLGTLSPRSNLEMVIDCFSSLDKRGVKVSLVVCGTGDAAAALMKRAAGAENIFFPGWMNAQQIRAIMSKSSGGIFPYNRKDFFNSLPNKTSEYLAGGLPIISCTSGEVRRLIEETGCGFWHEPDHEKMAELIAAFARDREPLMTAATRANTVHRKYFERESVFSNTRARLMRIVETRRERTRMNPGSVRVTT